eukprot:scaffold322_cov363-Pavlova_lutheri.AAC.6
MSGSRSSVLLVAGVVTIAVCRYLSVPLMAIQWVFGGQLLNLANTGPALVRSGLVVAPRFTRALLTLIWLTYQFILVRCADVIGFTVVLAHFVFVESHMMASHQSIPEKHSTGAGIFRTNEYSLLPPRIKFAVHFWFWFVYPSLASKHSQMLDRLFSPRELLHGWPFVFPKGGVSGIQHGARVLAQVTMQSFGVVLLRSVSGRLLMSDPSFGQELCKVVSQEFLAEICADGFHSLVT